MICSVLYGRGLLFLLVLDGLENEDGSEHRKAGKVAHRTGDDHQQTAGDQRDAADPLEVVDEIAHQAGGDGEHTERRGDRDGGNAPHGHVVADEDHRVVESEDVGDDERRDGETGRVEGGLHRGSLGDGGACVGSQRDGRGDIGDDTEVEDEHIRSQNVHTHAVDEDGRAGGGHDDVVRGGGNAHAKHDAADHRQEQSDDEVTVGEADHVGDELAAETGHRDAHGDDTGDAAGDTDGDAVLTAVFKAVDELGRGHAVILVDEADGDGSDGGIDGALGHGLTADDHVDQQDQGQEQVDLGKELAPLGQLFARQTLEAELLGLEVHAEEDAEEVQERGQDRADDDLGILKAGHFRHDERRSAHDRGHDLTAGGGSRLDRAGELAGIAGLLHHRDGDGTGGNGVTDGGAGDHAAEGGGNDRDLCRAAARPADQRVGAVDEEVGNARRFKEGAEHQEQRDVGRADGDRRADDAVGGVENVVHDQLKAHMAADERVKDEHARHAQDGNTDGTAAALSEHQNTDDAEDDLRLADGNAHADDAFEVCNVIEIRDTADDRQQNIVPRHVVGLNVALLRRVDEERKENDHTDEQAAADLAAPRRPEVHVNHEGHEAGQHEADDLLRHALPDADVGFAVVFFHDLVDIGGSADVGFIFNDRLILNLLINVSH